MKEHADTTDILGLQCPCVVILVIIFEYSHRHSPAPLSIVGRSAAHRPRMPETHCQDCRVVLL